jgi:hypothetical protein
MPKCVLSVANPILISLLIETACWPVGWQNIMNHLRLIPMVVLCQICQIYYISLLAYWRRYYQYWLIFAYKYYIWPVFPLINTKRVPSIFWCFSLPTRPAMPQGQEGNRGCPVVWISTPKLSWRLDWGSPRKPPFWIGIQPDSTIKNGFFAHHLWHLRSHKMLIPQFMAIFHREQIDSSVSQIGYLGKPP